MCAPLTSVGTVIDKQSLSTTEYIVNNKSHRYPQLAIEVTLLHIGIIGF